MIYRKSKIHIIYLIIVVIIIISVIYRNPFDNKAIKVYLIYGGNEYLELKNGYVKLSLNNDEINSGEIVCNINFNNIKSYTLTIYIDNNGEKNTLLTKSQMIKSGENINIIPTGGLVVKGKLLNNKSNILGNNFYLSFEYTDIYDNEFESILKLNVKMI